MGALSPMPQVFILLLPLLLCHMARTPHTLLFPTNISHRPRIPLLPRGVHREAEDGTEKRERELGEDGSEVY